MLPLLLLALASTSTALSSPTPAPAPDRTRTVIEAVHRSGAVPRCWNAYLEATPEAGSVRFRLRVEVNASGAIERVALLDPTPPPFEGCVRTQLRRLTVPAGAAVTVETTYSFTADGPAPVPTGP
jgi:hypothetical protein